MPKFSIITPQYNSYGLMERYFASLESQTFRDFEVIIVDDCSTDDSYSMLKERIQRTSLAIKLLQSQQNAGPGNARNLGVENATGEWITFVDNDDWVSNDYLEKVNQIIERKSVNCVICDYYISKDDNNNAAYSMYSCEEGEKTLAECIAYVRNHTFCKFYKRDNCKDVRFPEVRRCEDVAYVCQAISACGSAFYLKDPLYFYLQRATSLSNNKSLDESDMIKAFGILEKSIGKIFPNEIKEKSVSDLLYGVLLMMCKAKKTSKDICAYISGYEEKYPKWWECAIINKLGKSKKIFLLLARKRCILGMKILADIHSRLIK